MTRFSICFDAMAFILLLFGLAVAPVIALVFIVGAVQLAHLGAQHVVAAGFALVGIPDIYDWDDDGQVAVEMLSGFESREASYRQSRQALQAWVELNRAALDEGIRLKLSRHDVLGAWQDARRFSVLQDPNLQQLEELAWEVHMGPVWEKMNAIDEAGTTSRAVALIREAEVARQRKAEQEREKKRHQDRLADAMKHMMSTTNRREGRTRYFDRSMRLDRNQTGMVLFVEKNLHEEELADWDHPIHLGIRYQFVPRKPVRRGVYEDERYWHHVEVYADNQRQSFESLEWRGKVLEYVDTFAHDERDVRALQAIIQAKESIVSFDIDGTVHEVRITKAQKVAFQRVLDAFEALGGIVRPEKNDQR